jgi:hypothetical protein
MTNESNALAANHSRNSTLRSLEADASNAPGEIRNSPTTEALATILDTLLELEMVFDHIVAHLSTR